MGLAIADVLERANPDKAFVDMEASLKRMRNYPFSYMVRMVTPRVEGRAPAHVFRIDKQGVGLSPVGKTRCVTTNHYLTRNRKPVPRASAWSLTRYGQLEERLASTITREVAWEAQGVVASQNQAYATLHTLIVYPESRMIDLAFASWRDGKVAPATDSPPTEIRFDQLFARSGEPN